MVIIIILILSVNAISFTYYVSDYGKKLVPSNSKTSGPKVYLLCGAGAKCEKVFKHLHFPGYAKIYLEYSKLGFDPITAGIQLDSLVGTDDIVCGISIGARAINCSLIPPKQIILINPCIDSSALGSKTRKLIRILYPVLALIESILGWICVLPIISIGKGFQSLAVILDQLYWLGHDPKVLEYHTYYPAERYSNKVILNSDESAEYQKAINSFLSP